MSVEDNMRVIDAADKAFTAKDWDRFLGLHAESVVLYAPPLPEPLKGRAALKEFVQGFVKAFPDLSAEKVRSFGQGDWVAREYRTSGTHHGPLASPDGKTIPATHKRFQISECDVFKVEGGKITEVHLYFDQLGYLAQLGLAPQG